VWPYRWASINTRPLLPFKYQHLGDMMVLGKVDAAVALPVGDATVSGPLAALLRRATYLYRMAGYIAVPSLHATSLLSLFEPLCP
jgi:NADH dehydrogenase FAD-containing subunit